MKDYLYHFRYTSGDIVQADFYKVFSSETRRKAIIQIVAFFLNNIPENAEKYIESELEENWTIEQFNEDMDSDFMDNEGLQGYRLRSIQELPNSIQDIGEYI